jgi:hypothetical protein
VVVGGTVVVVPPKEVGVPVPDFAVVVDGPFVRMVVAVELVELELVVVVVAAAVFGVVGDGVDAVRTEVNEADS